MLNKLAIAAAMASITIGAAYAQTPNSNTNLPARTTTGVGTPAQAQVLTSLPTTSTTTIANFYKQNVYDPSEKKLGEISDVLVDNDGKIDGFIVSVGGFLGLGEKNVAVPFSAVQASQRNGSWWLTMNATESQLRNAPGFKYDRDKATWVKA
jgi:sporulation protein YlmC with PRC-barrel domain